MPKKRSLINSKILIFILIIIILIIFVLLGIQSGIIKETYEESTREIEIYQIEDTCSIIAGQLIHTITNEDDCQQQCISECDVRKREFYNSTFTFRTGNCNLCDCKCK